MMQNDFPEFGVSQDEAVEGITLSGNPVRIGDRVRLWPQKSADILDLALRGKVALIEGFERDFDNQVHVAVVLEDDPGRDLGMLRQPGHRFFFSPEEIELLPPHSSAPTSGAPGTPPGVRGGE